MILVRMLVLKGIQQNFWLFARHLPGVQNEVSDSLSRFDWVRFDKLAHKLGLKNTPQPLPEEL